MPVTAKVIQACWDSKTAQGFASGTVVDGFDPESESGKRLSSLITGMGEWIFQYPGHEGKVPKLEAKPRLPEPAKEPPKEDKRYKPMSAEHKRKMAEARARKKAAREEMAAA